MQLFTHIGRLYGVWNHSSSVSGEEMKNIPYLEHAWMQVFNGVILAIGTGTPPEGEAISLNNRWIIPGFVDSHCHLIFSGWREAEFEAKIKGASYEEIAAAGGGIHASAKRLAETSEEELFQEALARLNSQIDMGITAMEIKTGYGLLPEMELKMLRVANRIKAIAPIPIKITLLAAHAMPAKYANNREKFIKEVCENLIPKAVNEKLADYIDVFCDRGFFTPQETTQILQAAKKLGMDAKIHANELGLTGGVQVGVAANARSVDHLEHVGDEEINLLLNSRTIPTLLPATAFFLRIPYPPARKMLNAGLPIALATDLNPGSAPSGNPWFIWSLACIPMRMEPGEALSALTRNAAVALDLHHQCGSLQPGMLANFIAIQAESPKAGLAQFPYRFGIIPNIEVFIEGKSRNTLA